ncbi:MAG: N-acetyltransferase [Acidimicrobiia bacterium]|nr:N-acetyltransferase [Acidimicrobiia bacterium]
MPDPVTLCGAHVRLEPLSLAHVADLVAAAAQDRASYAFTAVPATLEAAEQYVQAALADQATGSSLPFATIDAASGAVVGSTRFLDLDYWDEPRLIAGPSAPKANAIPTVAEIGATWLAASAQRSAVNTEAKLLMLGHAFDQWKVHRVTLKTDARNHRSRQAIERLGAQFEGIRRAHVLATDGTIRDSAYYSIVAAEWPAVRRGLCDRLGR